MSTIRRLLLLALLVGLSAVTVASGQPAAANKKTFALEFKETPWRKVLDWLADKAELQIATTAYPTGILRSCHPRALMVNR
jgi:hypothetical protein